MILSLAMLLNEDRGDLRFGENVRASSVSVSSSVSDVNGVLFVPLTIGSGASFCFLAAAVASRLRR